MKRMAERWIQRIGACGTYEQLRALRDLIQPELHDRLLFSDLAEWNDAVNALHDALIRRTVALAEQQTGANTGKNPPGPYAFVLLGSGGRSEQTLWSDQDNGLIFRNEDTQSKTYFEQLSKNIEDGLKTVGYPPCEGNVAVGNIQWRKPAAEWKTMISEWFADATWENIRLLLIVADVRCVYGDPDLVDALRNTFDGLVQATPGIIDGMLRNTLRHKVVLGPLGNLIREPYGEEAGGFDVKYGAYIPMVNAIRLLAVKSRIRETNTLERIRQLRPFTEPETLAKWRSAFLTILKLRSMTPFQLTEEGYFTTRGKLRAHDLTKEVTSILKESLHAGEQLQKYIKRADR